MAKVVKDFPDYLIYEDGRATAGGYVWKKMEAAI